MIEGVLACEALELKQEIEIRAWRIILFCFRKFLISEVQGHSELYTLKILCRPVLILVLKTQLLTHKLRR